MKNWIIILLLFYLSACSYLLKEEEDSTANWSSDRLYAEARGALDSGNYGQAIEYYQKLEARFPFGTNAQQALLDLAYAHYKNDESDAVIAACERFIKLYPQNVHVDYAYYLRGLANFNRGRGLAQRLLPVDLAQRDQGSAQRAFQDFLELVKRFPESEYRADAEQRMHYLRDNLARNEVYVATYYMRRRAFVAAVNRARYVVENYERTAAVPGALVIMVKAYRILEMNDLADDALRILKYNYPDHPGIDEVKLVTVQ